MTQQKSTTPSPNQTMTPAGGSHFTADWAVHAEKAAARRHPLGDLLAEFSRNRVAYLLSLPAMLLVVLVSFLPIAYAFVVSLYQTRYMELRSFFWLGNYQRLFSEPAAQKDVFNSLVYAFGSLALAVPLGMVLAILLNQPIRFRAIYRVILIAPWVVSQTIVALLWSWLLNGNYGPLVDILGVLGLQRVDLLGSTETAMPAVIAANVWQSYPFALILILAALQTAPPELYEAVSIDGGNYWHGFRYVTFPFIRSTLLVVVIMLSLHYFNMVTLVLTMTAGGPVNATETVSLLAYKEAFMSWRIGVASAVGVVIFLVNMVLSLIYIRVLRREPLY